LAATVGDVSKFDPQLRATAGAKRAVEKLLAALMLHSDSLDYFVIGAAHADANASQLL